MQSKDYAADVLSPGWRRRAEPPRIEAAIGLVLEVEAGGFCGAVVEIDKAAVTLADRHDGRRLFPWTTLFLIDGRPVRLDRPVGASPVASRLTRSGSVAVPGANARVARASRILVEGRHDAELVEQVWGDDLRIEGVVVELLDGADNLPDAIAQFAPSANARLGVLLDHLVAGSKESRIVEAIDRRHHAHVLVTGHPFVDIWAAIRPQRVGLDRWPDVPRHLSWKDAMATTIGAPDSATAWRQIRGRVRDWRDLEPALIGPVERLIDWVTATEHCDTDNADN